jgi:hypothetical protein
VRWNNENAPTLYRKLGNQLNKLEDLPIGNIGKEPTYFDYSLGRKRARSEDLGGKIGDVEGNGKRMRT